MISQFNVPATIITGGGASQEVGRQLLRLGATRVLLVTDAYMIASGVAEKVTAVITDTARDVKMMMLDRHFLPTVALVDFELTLSMPSALTAHVGVDTLTHGIEAYVSRKATALTDSLALTCIRLVAEHL